jgi:uncharacterized protein YkwD
MRTSPVVTAGVAGMLAMLAMGPEAATRAPVQQACSPTAGQLALRWVNEERSKAGLRGLTADTMLIRAARIHAEDMAAHFFLSDTGSDGSNPARRLERVGYALSWVGENVSTGQESVDEVVRAWLRSESHRANILDPKAMSAGLAMERSSEGEFGTHWVMVYAAADPPSSTVVPCHP